MPTTDRHAGRGVPLFQQADSGVTKWASESVLPAEPWVQEAVCAQTDPDVFFPEKGGSTKAAKAVCASCDVVEQCLRYSLDHDERFGIWGGRSERERRRLRGVSKKHAAAGRMGFEARMANRAALDGIEAGS